MKQHFFSAALVVVTLLAFAVGGYALTKVCSSSILSSCCAPQKLAHPKELQNVTLNHMLPRLLLTVLKLTSAKVETKLSNFRMNSLSLFLSAFSPSLLRKSVHLERKLPAICFTSKPMLFPSSWRSLTKNSSETCSIPLSASDFRLLY